MIAVIMPTRGRPKAAVQVIGGFNATKGYTADLYWVLDPEDVMFSEYERLAELMFAPYLWYASNMVEATNKAAKDLTSNHSDYDIIGWCADDNRFVTPDWGRHVAKAFKDPKVGFVVPNDKHWQGSKANTVFTRASIIRALGYFALPSQEHLFVDDAWVKLAEESDSLFYMPELVIEHHNPLNTGVGKLDAQGEHTNRSELYVTDGKAYENWLRFGGLEEDAQKVRACLS